MLVEEVERLYRPYWKGTNAPNGVSAEAVIVVTRLSNKSISGFEGADFITLTPIISDALRAAAAMGRAEAQAQVLDDVLVMLAGFGYPTPEKGYKQDGGWAGALSDIKRCIRERDRAGWERGMEEAAKIAERTFNEKWQEISAKAGITIAASIRALKTTQATASASALPDQET